MTNVRSLFVGVATALLWSMALSCSRDGLTSQRLGDAGPDALLDAAAAACFQNGKAYAIGESVQVDCNTCTCTTSGFACTQRDCVSIGTGGMSGAGGSGAAPGSGGGPGANGGATSVPDAGPVVCIESGHTYAVGETFKRDCNTCTCTTGGVACTLLGCPTQTDAAVDLARPDAGGCGLSSNLTFGYEGGEPLYSDVNRLTASTFTITRNYAAWIGRAGATTATCSPGLPACGVAGAVTVATINADLSDPGVQSLWTLPQNPVPLFGDDPRPMDGTVLSIALDGGQKVLVGGQCASPAMSSCRSIPAGLVRLKEDLQQLATAMLADPACKGL
jgi:hypothetical protein